jgi:hypothetical protein
MIDLPPRAAILPLFLAILAIGCTPPQPSIAFTKIPPAAEGNPFKFVPIEGKVTHAKPGQQIVLYAKSRVWWIQPLANQPFTAIRPDSTWQTSIHPGTDYAALLVEPGYAPPLTTRELPKKEGPVLAIAMVPGAGPPLVL